MEWWQEVFGLVIALGWWRMTLILLATLLIGVFAGVSLIYLVMRFVHKDQVAFLDFFYLLFSKRPKVTTSSYSTHKFISTHGSLLEVQEPVSTPVTLPEVHESVSTPGTHQEVPKPVENPIPGLLTEFQHNYRIATGFSGENLLPLQTTIWDAHRYSAQKLPVNLREQLEQVYTDIHSLNTVVWFITELGHKSSFLEEEYRKLLASISKQLQKIKTDIEYRLVVGRPGLGVSRDGERVHGGSHFSE